MQKPVLALTCSFALAACSAAPAIPVALAELLYEAPEDAPTRLWLVDHRIVAAAVAVGPGLLPPAVRTAMHAVVPQGELVFQGREWGPRGEGFRIDKRYQIDGQEHLRTGLIAADGRILERAHSVPLREVPQAVLAACLKAGTDVTEVMIVSGPEREEYWRCVVGDRIGRTHVAIVELDGTLRSIARRVTATVEV